MPAADMVTTSLKMPQMESVTTDVRCRRANSELMRPKARQPGKTRRKNAGAVPFAAARIWKPVITACGPSTKRARTKSVTNMMGARKNIVAYGLPVAGWRRRRICVRAQRKPEKKDAAMTRVKPIALNSVSPATIMTTPAVIVAIIAQSFQEGVSRRKRNAKRRTKAREEDLTMVRKVKVTKRRDVLPRPMSRDVAVPQGRSRVR